MKIYQAYVQYTQYISSYGYKASSMYGLDKQLKTHGTACNGYALQPKASYLGIVPV